MHTHRALLLHAISILLIFYMHLISGDLHSGQKLTLAGKYFGEERGRQKKSLHFLGLWSAGWMRSVELGQSVSYYIQENIWIPAQGSRVCGSHLCCISIEYQTTFSAFWIIKLNSLGLPYGLLLKYFQTLAAVLFLKERFLFPLQALLVQKMLVAKAKYINLPNISWVLRRAEKWKDREKQIHFEIGSFFFL